MSGVSHILFINPLLTRLSQVLTLCGLEFHVSYVSVDYTIMFILFYLLMPGAS